MPTTIALELPTLEEVAAAVRRCAETEPSGELEGLAGEALLPEGVLQDGDPPREPGIYVWSDPHGAVLYIGRAVDLSRRLGDELDWVRGYDPVGDRWEVSVVHLLAVHQARPRWARASSGPAAEEAERRLIEWHRALVGIAPVAVGWDVKVGSHQGRAQSWARTLWDEAVAGSSTDPRNG